MYSYPDWLGRDLVGGALPWTGATPGSLPAFLDRYPLDDVHWIGLYTEPDRRATLLLRWNRYWTEGHSAPDANTSAPEAILAIRFESLERNEVRLRDRRISTVMSGAANRAADWHRTQLTDHRGGEATLIHSPAVRLMCLSTAREPLPLLVPAETV
ncbi:MAG TPA: hypothetical protein VFT84_07310 [Gemmatimonadales bacterium]|nr:hypothetical protein [Gemmatimonadales bacterium]